MRRRPPAHTSITVRNLPAGVKQRLRARAAAHGRSLEAEARHILAASTEHEPSAETGGDLARRIRGRFAPFGGLDLAVPLRGPAREPPRFDWD
jgi:plasmid stability protein